MLDRRLQVLLDQASYDRLARRAAERGTSIGALVREAVDAQFPVVEPRRKVAARRILASEPMEVPDHPEQLKREISDTRSALA